MRPFKNTTMIIYLVNIIQEFFPVALIAGMMLALWKYTDETLTSKHVTYAFVAGLFCGGILFGLTPDRFSVADMRTYLGAINLAVAVLTVPALWFSLRRNSIIRTLAWAGSLSIIAALSAGAAFSFILFASDRTLFATSVLNTGAILSLGGIISGVAIIILLTVMTARMGRKAGRGFTLSLFTVTAVLLILISGADAVLGLMRAKIIELTSARLTFAAKVTNFSSMLSYVLVFFLGLLFFVSFFRRPVLSGDRILIKADKRKALSRVLRENRWLKIVAVTIAVVVSVMLYYDLYASRPPQISAPIRLIPDADGLINVKTDDVKDGRLHRFSYVTDDGHVIRFFMINLYKDRTKIGVVFDACVMCGGEKGYIQKGNDVICLACNVRIFVPSIGKEGGCNPIPLKHTIQSGDIIISVKELETEKDYFPATVTTGGGEQGAAARVYNGVKTAVNALLRIKRQDEEPGKCHLNLASVKGQNT